MIAPVLRVRDLCVERSGHLAVENVSFDLHPESETAVVGPNGAGKTTLISAVLGLLRRKSGDVEILGKSLGQNGYLPPEVRTQIAYVPQCLTLQGHFPLTVSEFVAFGFDPPGPRIPFRHCHAKRIAVQHALEWR